MNYISLLSQAPVITVTLTDISAPIGQMVEFQCQLDGKANPTPTVEWWKDGHLLVVDRAFHSVGDKLVLLKIHSLEFSDGGMYTCYLTNKSGTVCSSAVLTILSKWKYCCG